MRHSYPQNNIIPRLPGKYESRADAAQNLFENDFGTSDIVATDNPEDVGNDRDVYHSKHDAHDSIAPAIENDSEVPPNKSKPSTFEPSKASFQTPFIAKPAAEIDKQEIAVVPKENNPAYKTITPEPSTADNAQNNDGAVNFSTPHNYHLNENNGEDNQAISSGSLRFIASATIEKSENIKESTSLQIPQPLFTTSSSLQPNVTVPLITGEANHQPVIKVHIGRIEVKAINQPPATDGQTKKSNVNKPTMSLDDYLKKRNAR